MSDEPIEQLAELISAFMQLAQNNDREIKRLAARLDSLQIGYLCQSLDFETTDNEPDEDEPERIARQSPQARLTATDASLTRFYDQDASNGS